MKMEQRLPVALADTIAQRLAGGVVHVHERDAGALLDEVFDDCSADAGPAAAHEDGAAGKARIGCEGTGSQGGSSFVWVVVDVSGLLRRARSVGSPTAAKLYAASPAQSRAPLEAIRAGQLALEKTRCSERRTGQASDRTNDTAR